VTPVSKDPYLPGDTADAELLQVWSFLCIFTFRFRWLSSGLFRRIVA
jgi:hypothetical protein